jgi:hypothetical protein
LDFWWISAEVSAIAENPAQKAILSVFGLE